MLEPIAKKFADGDEPSAAQIEELAAKPFARHYLYAMLKHYERLDLFPEEYRSEQSQAAAKLAFWMMHPNELEDAPQEMEHVQAVTREIDGESCRFYVFRYRMPAGHWAGDQWLLGYAGPFIDNESPYSDLPGAFSKCDDIYGEANPEKSVDWFIAMVRRKSGAPA